MSGRSAVGLAVGAALAVLLVAGAWLALRSRRPAPPAERVTAKDERAAPVRTPTDLVPTESKAPPVEKPAAPSRGPEPAGRPIVQAVDHAARLVAELLASLQGIEERHPDAFHARASAALVGFASSVSSESALAGEGRRAVVTALLDALGGTSATPLVRGALLAALGGLGATEDLLDRLVAPGEEQRSGLIGLAWQPLAAAAEGTITFDPAEYLRWSKRGELRVLELPMSRAPEGRVEDALEVRILTPPRDVEEWLQADLSILALGTAVDTDPRVLSFLIERLRDQNALLQPLHNAICYVLARSRSKEAREVLRAYLDAPAANEWEEFRKSMLRRWIAAGPSQPGDLEFLVAPLLDGRVPRDMIEAAPKIQVIDVLLKRLDNASPQEYAQLEDIFAQCALQPHDEFVHDPIVTMFATIPGSTNRLYALDHVLRTDPSAGCRVAAARGLGAVEGSLVETARGMLQRALSGEQDPTVHRVISDEITRLR